MLISGISLLESTLYIALFVVCGAMLVAAVVCSFARVTGFVRYHKYNKRPASCGLTGAEAARKLLDSRDMADVEVKKAGFFRAMVWGNSYAPRKKTIYLRRGIVNKDSMTSVALACEKVGLAQQHHDKDKKYMAYAKLVPYCPFIPIMFLPMVLVGAVLDVIFFKAKGVVPIIVAALGIILYICALVLTILNVPVEKKATKIALDIMAETNLLNAQEMVSMGKLYQSYITQYVTDMVIAILQIVKYILQALLYFVQHKDN